MKPQTRAIGKKLAVSVRRTRQLPRRTFLAGLGGACVPLPFLEIMTGPDKAHAQAKTKRFVLGFGGISLAQTEYRQPSTTGPNFTLPRSWRSLQPVQQHVSLVSGLKIPWLGERGSSSIEPGGRETGFHGNTVGPLLSGMDSASGRSNYVPGGPTPDQLAVPQLSGNTPFPSLEYRVQPVSYRGGAAAGRVSFSRNDNGEIVSHEPIAQPSLAYEQLFANFVPENSPDVEAQTLALKHSRSVIDMVATRAERLQPLLGASDAQRLEQHFDEIRDLENRLGMIPEPRDNCSVPDPPGPDAPSNSYPEEGRDSRIIGYSQEEDRAKVMTDLVYLALACDLAHVASLQFTFGQTFMSGKELLGVGFDFHEIGHGAGSQDDLSDTMDWHMKHWASLIEKLASSPEAEGTLLDSTALMFLCEGGRGWDPEGVRDDNVHSTENMMVVLAGNGSRLRLGEHFNFDNGRHPAEASLAVLRSVDIDEPLGAFDTPISELLT